MDKGVAPDFLNLGLHACW